MQLRVREYDGGVDIELLGVAGRQLDVLTALTECQRGNCCGTRDDQSKLDSMSVRSKTNEMRIRLKAKAGESFDATGIYQCLKQALYAKPRSSAALLTA